MINVSRKRHFRENELYAHIRVMCCFHENPTFQIGTDGVSKECHIYHMDLIIVTPLVTSYSTTKIPSYCCFITGLQASVHQWPTG